MRKINCRHIANNLRTWIKFHFKYPWVKHNGFVRLMPGVGFARCSIQIGNRVQFGNDCKIAYNVSFGNNILMASRVTFVGKADHSFNFPGKYIWDMPADKTGRTVVEDDVWIGTGSIIMGPIIIGAGSIIAAGSVVNKDIPPCEIWGGVPAKKIRDRFETEKEKAEHLIFLENAKAKTSNQL